MSVCFIVLGRKKITHKSGGFLLFALNPEFAVAIYCGLKILAATLVVCF